MPVRLRLIDSITELHPADHGCVAVSGSHGGRSAAAYALAVRPLLSVFNDAGVGRDAAGIAALTLLQAQSLAACAVAHHSARIGEASSTLAHGVISHTNAAAHGLGLRSGQALEKALQALHSHLKETQHDAAISQIPPQLAERRRHGGTAARDHGGCR